MESATNWKDPQEEFAHNGNGRVPSSFWVTIFAQESRSIEPEIELSLQLDKLWWLINGGCPRLRAGPYFEGCSSHLAFHAHDHTPMVYLPSELLGAIVAEVHSQPDLLRFRTINKSLNAFATPFAFRSIQFSNTDKSLQNFKCLANHPKFAPLIREVVYQYKEADASTCERLFKRHI